MYNYYILLCWRICIERLFFFTVHVMELVHVQRHAVLRFGNHTTVILRQVKEKPRKRKLYFISRTLTIDLNYFIFIF